VAREPHRAFGGQPPAKESSPDQRATGGPPNMSPRRGQQSVVGPGRHPPPFETPPVGHDCNLRWGDRSRPEQGAQTSVRDGWGRRTPTCRGWSVTFAGGKQASPGEPGVPSAFRDEWELRRPAEGEPPSGGERPRGAARRSGWRRPRDAEADDRGGDRGRAGVNDGAHGYPVPELVIWIGNCRLIVDHETVARAPFHRPPVPER